MIPRDRLSAMLRARDTEPLPQPAPLPSRPDVLYTGPNPDGSRKTCGSCWKWVTDGTCLEVAGEVMRTQVCGSHVFGKPQVTNLAAYTGAGDGAMPVLKMTAEEAGLIETPNGEGTSCDLCRFFEDNPAGGENVLCNGIGSELDGLPPIVVDRLGCCSRWTVAE